MDRWGRAPGGGLEQGRGQVGGVGWGVGWRGGLEGCVGGVGWRGVVGGDGVEGAAGGGGAFGFVGFILCLFIYFISNKYIIYNIIVIYIYI